MSSAVIGLAPAKSPKKRIKSPRKKKGPTVSDLIVKALSASTERGGVSLAAIKKDLKAAGYDVLTNRARIIIAIRRLVANKSLVQIKGTGASGSFKLNKKPSTPRKKKVVKKKKEPKAKGTSAKKAVGAASPAAKKSPKKRRKTKSPKKAKRPAAAKKPKSPKKAKRRVSKSARTKAAAKK